MTHEQFESRYDLSHCCCFTGHRAIPAEESEGIRLKIQAEAENLINKGVVVFIAGGALGFDTIAARTVLALKSKYPFIKLVLALPCDNQSEKWSDCNKRIYDDILSGCDLAHYVNRAYKNDCMRLRNEYMVKHAKYCVCYLRKQCGGTAYTVGYAKRMERVIISI